MCYGNRYNHKPIVERIQSYNEANRIFSSPRSTISPGALHPRAEDSFHRTTYTYTYEIRVYYVALDGNNCIPNTYPHTVIYMLYRPGESSSANKPQRIMVRSHNGWVRELYSGKDGWRL